MNPADHLFGFLVRRRNALLQMEADLDVKYRDFEGSKLAREAAAAVDTLHQHLKKRNPA